MEASVCARVCVCVCTCVCVCVCVCVCRCVQGVNYYQPSLASPRTEMPSIGGGSIERSGCGSTGGRGSIGRRGVGEYRGGGGGGGGA